MQVRELDAGQHLALVAEHQVERSLLVRPQAGGLTLPLHDEVMLAIPFLVWRFFEAQGAACGQVEERSQGLIPPRRGGG